jgi:ApbE superfamily uncharacterized protein (UPF0280 family)
MKRIASETLDKLPSEVKGLVRSGVYSLYALGTDSVGAPAAALGGSESELASVASVASVAYALVTNGGDQYFLSSDGELVVGVDASELTGVISEVVAFSDLAPEGVMINCR